MKNKRGFTLIELLVVIAIIGVLSAVVLASLNTARSKGNDAAVQTDMEGIRNQAQIYYGDHTNSYGVAGTNGSSCALADNAGNLFEDATVARQITGADTANGAAAGMTCNVSGTAYAASAALVATPGSYYCVDSTGAGMTTTNALGTNTACS